MADPAVIAGEIAWRWIFGISALALAFFAAIRLEHAIVIYPEEHEILGSRSPILITQAILEIAHRARSITAHLGIIVIPAILLLWIVAATVGRGYILARLNSPNLTGPHWPALLTLNLLRVATVALLVPTYYCCSFATTLVVKPYEPNYALAILTFLCLFAIALAIWSLLQWILSIACIYAGRQGFGAAASLNATLRLLRRNHRELFSISAQNSSARTLLALIFTLLALPTLAISSFPQAFWIVEIVLFLVYCAVSDVLLLARLAAYVEVTDRAHQNAVAEHA